MKKFVAKKRKQKLKQAAGFRKGVVNKLKGYRKKEKNSIIDIRKRKPSVVTPRDIYILERVFSSLQTNFVLPGQSLKSISMNYLIF